MLNIPRKETELVVDFVDLDSDGKLDDCDFIYMVNLFTINFISKT